MSRFAPVALLQATAFRTTWEGTVTNVVGTGGWCSAKASGTAVLSNGWICKSGGPMVKSVGVVYEV
jgi:hypothetical protein